MDPRSVSVGSHFGPQEIRRIPGAAEGAAAVVALTNTFNLSSEFNGSHFSSPRRALVRVSWMF